jgi:arylsulfatase A-like enzyme
MSRAITIFGGGHFIMNIVLFVIDTLRADHLSCYGYFRETSPNIDKLADEGVLFQDHYAAGVPTGPGFTSIVTGMYPINHEFYITPWNIPNSYQMDDDILVLPEVLWESGYVTAAFDNLVNFRSRMKHFIRGYEYYINVTRSANYLHHHIWADLVNQKLLPWIDEHKDDRFFLFVHYWDPHTPYNQPKEFQEIFRHKKGDLSDLEVREAKAGYEYVPGWGKADEIFEGRETRWGWPIPGERFADELSIEMYDGEIAYVDDRLGQVIEKLKEKDLYDDTLIIVTSDHGENLGQHGMWEHGGVYEPVIYVPLIMVCPSVLPKEKRVEGFAQQVDISTTIFELADVPLASVMERMETYVKKTGNPAYSKNIRGFTDGVNLLDLMDGREIRDYIIAETGNVRLIRGAEDKIEAKTLGIRTIREDEWKLIVYSNGRKELFNIEEDPMEIRNLADEKPEIVDRLNSSLNAWITSNLNGREDPILRNPASY